MTLELNIFHLCKRHLHPEEEEGLEEVCLINTLVEEHCDKNLEESLNKSLGVLEEGLLEPSDVLAIMSPWRRREEILPLFNKEDSQGAATEDPPKLVLKSLPVDLKYAYLEEDEKCPVVISSTFTSDQEDSLLGILRKYKKDIGWQIYDLKGISPLVCTHHIYMEEDAKPVRQPQRRLNPHIHEVPSKGEKQRGKQSEENRGQKLQSSFALLEHFTKSIFYVLYTISKLRKSRIQRFKPCSLWVSPTQVVPKKSGITVIQNEKGEEVSTRLTSRWRVCIDYRRLNSVTRKNHFPLPSWTKTLRESQGILSIVFGWRMPFGLCNAPATFQRCMLNIFSDMVEHIMKVFIDDITVYGVLIRNKAKVELIVKFPPPTNVKGNRHFLGHAGFYRRFIKDFSKISKPLCELLVKDAKFVWDEKCQKSFEELKQCVMASDLAMGGCFGVGKLEE
ncbi:hypothetical protein CK203_110766 [Vitis vinifera]|uniref:Retrovirus-related Pol polyprotein from transposon 17.6 n=1 Tax=Vitis vinifera TaxID=29760 RepID=A0A438CES9_VITVI|nr:hypothetical protein CK203_110766 [Vitis vinifera]